MRERDVKTKTECDKQSREKERLKEMKANRKLRVWRKRTD